MPRWRRGTIMDTIDRAAGSAEAAARLLTWLSPSFPVGAFSYSHGLEQAVEAGLVADRATLIAWIEGILRYGAGRIDGMLLLEAHRSVTLSDAERLRDVAALAAAMRGSAELALESNAQGAAFWKAIGAGWPALAQAPVLRPLADAPAKSYPVTVGAVTAAAGINEVSVLYALSHRILRHSGLIGAAFIADRTEPGPRRDCDSGAHDRLSGRCSARHAVRKSGRRGAHGRLVQHEARNPGNEVVQVMSLPVRIGVGGPVGSGKTALLERLCRCLADSLRDRGHHQRHLYQRGRQVPHQVRRAADRAHRRGGDRRMPPHRDPRGRLDQSRRGRRHVRQVPAARAAVR